MGYVAHVLRKQPIVDGSNKKPRPGFPAWERIFIRRISLGSIESTGFPFGDWVF